MDQRAIDSAVAEITAEKDPTLKNLKLASLCSALWREQGVELVVVGGSAIEFLTEGAYTSGDLDLCHLDTTTLPLRQRQELMGRLGAKGGPRNWQVAGAYIDLLGPVESFARTPFRQFDGLYGRVWVMKPEDLLVERVLVSFYPEPNETALECARTLIAVALRKQVEMDWAEVAQVANRPEYRNLNECKSLVNEVARKLKIQNPYDSHGSAD